MELKNKYTRKIDREYQRLLLTNSITKTDTTGDLDIQIDSFQLQIARDYLIRELFWLSQDELDKLEMSEYQKCLDIAEAEKNFL